MCEWETWHLSAHSDRLRAAFFSFRLPSAEQEQIEKVLGKSTLVCITGPANIFYLCHAHSLKLRAFPLLG